MASIEDSEPVWLSRIVQNLYELRPPLTWDTSADERIPHKSVELGRVAITWDERGGNGDPRVDVVAWVATYDREPYNAVFFPALLDLFAPVIDATRPVRA